MGAIRDLSGQRFGKLIVLEVDKNETKKHKGRNVYWKCLCDCGNYKSIVSGSLTNGTTKSCGCLIIQSSKDRNKKYNTYDLSGEYGIGYTSKGEEFYFDLEDYGKIKDYCWHISGNGYVQAQKPDKKRINLHSLILPSTNIVDHINRNKNDCRKSNLRICSYSENNRNNGLKKNNTSGIIGVNWNKTQNKWQARVHMNGKAIHLGFFSDMTEAIKARLLAEQKYYGEFAPQKHLYEKFLDKGGGHN